MLNKPNILHDYEFFITHSILLFDSYIVLFASCCQCVNQRVFEKNWEDQSCFHQITVYLHMSGTNTESHAATFSQISYMFYYFCQAKIQEVKVQMHKTFLASRSVLTQVC